MLAYFDELRRTEWLSRDELLALQQAKRLRLIEYAYQYVPYYRRTFDAVGFHPEDLRREPAVFQRLPVVTKDDMRQHYSEFMTTHPAVRKTLTPRATSGSTGEPFRFWEDRQSRDSFTATFFWYLTWSNCQLGEPSALLWGQTGGPTKTLSVRLRRKFTDFVFNVPITIPASVLSDDAMALLARRIKRVAPRVLLSYASTLFVFAQFVRRHQLDVRFAAAHTSGEILYPDQRRYIEETFGCKVFNRYGTLENRGIACECERHTGMHLNVASCCVEIMRNAVPVEDEEPGEILLTNLTNYGFPFIRYRVKDVAQWLNQPCECGRRSPRLAAIQGRVGDLFRTTTGRTVWSAGFDFEFFKLEGVKQYQVVQKALDLVVVRLVKDVNFPEAQIEVVEKKLKDMMGPETRIQFEFPDHIPIATSGKYRYSYSELPEPRPLMVSPAAAGTQELRK